MFLNLCIDLPEEFEQSRDTFDYIHAHIICTHLCLQIYQLKERKHNLNHMQSKDPLLNHMQCKDCSETSLTGESRSHISTPLGIWTWVRCDGKQTDSPLGQWDMVRMKWDCRLSTGLPPTAVSIGCEARRETCSERETGTGKLCEIKWDYHIVGMRA